MPTPDQADVYITKLAGFAGACASLTFVKGSWLERISMAVGGAIVSLYSTPWAAGKTGLPEGLSGFLLGLFGMAICAKIWETIQATPIAELWKSALDVLKRKLGA
jgi:pilus assembly protein TadC